MRKYRSKCTDQQCACFPVCNEWFVGHVWSECQIHNAVSCQVKTHPVTIYIHWLYFADGESYSYFSLSPIFKMHGRTIRVKSSNFLLLTFLCDRGFSCTDWPWKWIQSFQLILTGWCIISRWLIFPGVLLSLKYKVWNILWRWLNCGVDDMQVVFKSSLWMTFTMIWQVKALLFGNMHE